MWISSNFGRFFDFFNGNPHPLSLRAVYPTPKAFQGYFTPHLEIGFRPAVEKNRSAAKMSQFSRGDFREQRDREPGFGRI